MKKKDHVKFETYKICKYDKICAGIWKEYVERGGGKEFIPIK